MALDKNDHEESQPLLGDVERNVEAQAEAPVHVCARCASEIRAGVAFEDPHRRHHSISVRDLLLAASILFCVALFVLSIVNMTIGSFLVGELFVCLWAFLTEFVVTTLIYAGWRRRKVGKFILKLSKNTTQIAVLCLLALSWIPLATGAIIEAKQVCSWRWYRARCAILVWVEILVWFLMITLSGAAFATYRCAVKMHGRELVDNPNKIPAWRLSEVNSVEGAVKL
uniref:MARVEL domain-containing protein n=1 Tax=Mycena chlorophos TaxID=658473 RepID=A0ABQ0LR59_MYCCL|nr:predicted protein [Mycena chlorophos]